MTVLLSIAAAAVIAFYLVRRPPMNAGTKLLLFLGIFVLPIGAAATGNVHGYSVSQTREFCSSCHVMVPYTDDSASDSSKTLAAMHAKNAAFGENNCYTCHSDYGLYGTVLTKISGLHHVWAYYTEYSAKPLEDVIGHIELYKPFSNKSCLRCHTTRTELFQKVKDHQGADEDLRTDRVSCVSEGCHGPAHPFSKLAQGSEAGHR